MIDLPSEFGPCSCQKNGTHKVIEADGATQICTVRTLPTGEHVKIEPVIVGRGTLIECHIIDGEIAYEAH